MFLIAARLPRSFSAYIPCSLSAGSHGVAAVLPLQLATTLRHNSECCRLTTSLSDVHSPHCGHGTAIVASSALSAAAA